ncbi:hypothetical protein B0H16DRAFT_1510268 [Mycena metata]|uniref:DUF6699 domain-containing protein n=1 Tax=Mycena metata TaxID=1033252 RepID=A0AAD7NSK8_9AGAR|nr:hypothetical protein B0H16DRAFT_1510268 [Mycena metata]
MLFKDDDRGFRSPYNPTPTGASVAFPTAPSDIPKYSVSSPYYAPPASAQRWGTYPHTYSPSSSAGHAVPIPHQRQYTRIPRLDPIPVATQPHHPQSRIKPIPLPPQITGVTTVILHPALAKPGTPIAVDLASLPSAALNAAWHQQPATHPPLPSLTIISPCLPWAITAHASGRMVRCLSVADVFAAIWETLCFQVDEQGFRDWRIMTQGGCHSPRRRRRRDRITYREGMSRMELLGERTTFSGLSASDMGCDTWVLEVA